MGGDCIKRRRDAAVANAKSGILKPLIVRGEVGESRVKTRCRRERFNARNPVDAYSSNRKPETLSLESRSSTTFWLAATSQALMRWPPLHLSRRAPAARADLSLDNDRLGLGPCLGLQLLPLRAFFAHFFVAIALVE